MSGIIRAPGGHVTVNETVRKMNPQVFAAGGSAVKLAPAPALQAADCKRPSAQSDASIERPARRIRQSAKPKLNQTEQAALEWLKRTTVYFDLRPHALTLELANGCKYTPDIIGTNPFTSPEGRTIYAWEVKGKHAWDDAIVKLKVAARDWPMIHFRLIWREDKAAPFQCQEILP